MDLEMNQFKRRYDENFITFALLNVHSFTYTRKIIYSISKSSRFITRIWFFQTGLASQLVRAIYCVPQACYQIREVDRDEREVEVRVLRLENERRLYKALYIPRNSSFNVSVSPLLSQLANLPNMLRTNSHRPSPCPEMQMSLRISLKREERRGHPWLFRINSPREIEFSPAAAGGIIFAVIQTE